jgi:hypothetical protein
MGGWLFIWGVSMLILARSSPILMDLYTCMSDLKHE